MQNTEKIERARRARMHMCIYTRRDGEGRRDGGRKRERVVQRSTHGGREGADTGSTCSEKAEEESTERERERERAAQRESRAERGRVVCPESRAGRGVSPYSALAGKGVGWGLFGSVSARQRVVGGVDHLGGRCGGLGCGFGDVGNPVEEECDGGKHKRLL